MRAGNAANLSAEMMRAASLTPRSLMLLARELPSLTLPSTQDIDFHTRALGQNNNLEVGHTGQEQYCLVEGACLGTEHDLHKYQRKSPCKTWSATFLLICQ
ncbi:hypothetical protein J3459_017193 [Metarhizium acridum]|nr:hypothetical protein J3459_017193 [Metarhizium acridum]